MNLAKIKAKETKGKQKLLPKLKTILANPVKTRSPTLDDDELDCLQNIIQTSIASSGVEQNKYATCKRICLGLECCLRAINNQQSACVFISLSIKPHHIVSLIARNAEVKDETQPVYAQPRLEDFTEKLFGVRALCMVLPKDLKTISEDLWKWVEQRRKPSSCSKEKELKIFKKHKSKAKKVQTEVKAELVEYEEKNEQHVDEAKSWTGEFISFNDSTNVATSKIKSKKDKNEALDVLSRIMDKVPKVDIKPLEKCDPMEVVDEKIPDLVDHKEPEAVESENSVDFLDEYKSLIVHKIKANPNKKPKKKRNKNKNKTVKK